MNINGELLEQIMIASADLKATRAYIESLEADYHAALTAGTLAHKDLIKTIAAARHDEAGHEKRLAALISSARPDGGVRDGVQPERCNMCQNLQYFALKRIDLIDMSLCERCRLALVDECLGVKK